MTLGRSTSATRKLGRGRVGSLHLNDSQTPLGSNRDRHANIGEGELGERGLRGVPVGAALCRSCRACSRRPGENREGPTAEEIALGA